MSLICQSRWWLLNDRHCMAETASHRAVSVQSQGPSQFNSLSVSLLPHFKRWHIKELLLLDSIHLYTHKVDHTYWAIYILTQRQHAQGHKHCTYSCGCTRTHSHTQNTYYNAAFWAGCVGRWHCLTLSHLLSALPALLWDIARCLEGKSKKERNRERQREREKVRAREMGWITCGSTPVLERSEKGRKRMTKCWCEWEVAAKTAE